MRQESGVADMDKLRFRCVNCSRRLTVRFADAGRRFRCRDCGTVQRAPSISDVASADAATAPPPPVRREVSDEQTHIPPGIGTVPERADQINFAQRDSAPTDEYRYDAFVSYRHVQPDRKWAKWLHTALETYRTPKKLVQQRGIASRVTRVFRDEEELPASADLSQVIDTALQQSRFLIVVCSRRTPESEWVNREVLRFRELGRNDQVLALLIDGEPSEAFPVALREIRRTIIDVKGRSAEKIDEVEPLAADVREFPARGENSRYLRRMARLRLLAAILGCRFDDLRQREQERNARQLRVTGTVLGLLLTLMTVLTTVATTQKIEADRQRDNADSKTREARELSDANAILAVQEREARLLAERELRFSQLGIYNVQLARVRDIWRHDQAEALRLLGSPKHCPEEFRDFAWRLLHHLSNRTQRTIVAEGLSAYALSTDGENLAAAGKSLTIWNAKTGQVRHNLPDVSPRVEALAFSTNGEILASAGKEPTITLWDVYTGTSRQKLSGHSDWVYAVAFSPDGSLLASAGRDQTIRLWNTDSEIDSKTLNGHSAAVRCVAFSPRGDMLASGSDDHTVTLWDASACHKIAVLSEQSAPVVSVAFSPDGKYLATSGDMVRLFEIVDRQQRLSLPANGTVAFSPNGETLLTAGTKLWDTNTGQEMLAIDGQASEQCYFPDGRSLAIRTGDTIKVCNALTTMSSATLVGHHGEVHSVAVSADNVLASADDTGIIRLWDLESGDSSQEFASDGPSVYDLAFSRDGRLLASAGVDKVEIWNPSNGNRQCCLDVHQGAVLGVEFGPSDTMIATAGEGGIIQLWDLQTSKHLQSMKGHQGDVNCVTFAPGGSLLASCGDDKTVRLWDLETGQIKGTLIGHDGLVYCVAFSRDGATLLSSSFESVILWDIETGHPRAILREGVQAIRAVAFSPDGKTFASGGLESIQLWDAETTQMRAVLDGHEMVSTIAFSADGHTLVSGSRDRTIKLWKTR